MTRLFSNFFRIFLDRLLILIPEMLCITDEVDNACI